MRRFGQHAARLAAAIALGITTASCGQAPAQDAAGGCGPPPPWRTPESKPGRLLEELSACLKGQAYAARQLAIPLASAAAGVVAQCEVEVDRFEGVSSLPGSDEEQAAEDREAVRQATEAVTHYRNCADR